MSILIKTVRIANFRGLQNIEVELESTSILTGMNNTGKTSFLKALQLALGSRQFISQEDFFIQEGEAAEKITIDLFIIPVNKNNQQIDNFSESWRAIFTIDKIRTDGEQFFIPLRTTIVYDEIKTNFKIEHFLLKNWPDFQGEKNWFEVEVEANAKTSFYFDEILFFYMDAQRDILEDIKLKNSYLGKMLSTIEYDSDDIQKMEKEIKALNEKMVNSSSILTNLKTVLQELDSAMDTSSTGIEITPFTQKIRDLNKGLSIYYADNKDSFSMEYHGMGTRSWSSLLTLKSFISLLFDNAAQKSQVFFPILAIEEPEAHLHPNAQKKLYTQLNAIKGQKIISTHSPYIAASAELEQLRHFYKTKQVSCSSINITLLQPEDRRKIKREVINSKGEIFFSKAMVLFEGETEEQALPIFAEKYFGVTSFEMGLDFVGVGGYGNYLPFLRFAEFLKIPWFILSDGEDSTEKPVKQRVLTAFKKSESTKKQEDCIVFLEQGNNFEKQLIQDGFTSEIKAAILSLDEDEYANAQHEANKKPKREQEVNDYTEEVLYNIITKNKTQYAPAIAEQIIKKDTLPPKVKALFEKIEISLNIQGKINNE